MPKINYAKLYTLRADGRYQGYYRDLDKDGNPTGKRHTICDRDPEKLYQKIQEKETPGNNLFRSVAEKWEEERREQIEPKTWKNYSYHYKDIVEEYGNRDVSDITAQEIFQDLVAAKAKQYSRTVVNTRRVVWNGIFEYAVAHCNLYFNPAAMVSLPRNLPSSKRRAPTDEEIAIVRKSRDLDFGFFPYLLLCTGMRKSEALALTKADIDLKNSVIHVRHGLDYVSNSRPTLKSPKTEHSNRDIPIIDVLSEPLMQHLKRTHGDILFPPRPSSRNPKPTGFMSEHQYENLWNQYALASGLAEIGGDDPITAHHLRHGTATLLFEAGVDAYTAAAMLGHSDVKITMSIYTALRKKQQAKSIRKFDRAMSKMDAPKK